MALDKNYSTINELNKIFSINENYRYFSRTIVQIDYPNYQQGITSGDVIRYDPSNFSYVKSFANSSINSEVFGIVESVSSDGTLNVVTNGSIILNPGKTINVTGTNSGGNDIYFLSGISAGFIQNYGPTYADYIIKPIYQVGPHGNYTGIVRNYIGYKNPAIQIQPNQVLVAIS